MGGRIEQPPGEVRGDGRVLQMLGLDAVAEAVYREMLTSPGGGVRDLSARLALPEAQIREALDRLAGLLLLRASRDVPGELRAVSPELGLELILRRQEEDLARRQQELAVSKVAAARAVAEYADLKPNTAGAGAERLVGLDAIQAKLEELAREVSVECLSMLPGGAQSQAALDASRPLDQDALRRGITCLTLYQDSARSDPATCAYAQWMTGQGGRVRTAPTLPARLLVFDREAAVVPMDAADPGRGALCTREPWMVSLLVALFENAWDTARPFGADRAPDRGTGLDPAERELLKLLAAGMTDEAAGKRLGVSLRTVRRQMAALMERLGATSRFQAGLKAARRGWL